ncbi:MAG: thioesterase [Gammaproteobacteria bacterium RIFCSPHIGHO2_12_FULL_45_9]|nr:MAG: thioesterase [Gammaproteobacteria bacterium RIFCSPHIGHO2_12_FULL_45_9]
MLSLQQQYATKSICYGCGPANEQGFQLASFVEGDHVIARFTPQPWHHAFPNVVCGGVIGTVLDCHLNWTAAWFLMQHQQLTAPPCTVTAEYQVALKRPTPMNTELLLSAALISIDGNRATTTATLMANDKICATGQGVFVAVNEQHPAFHRW